MTWVLAQISKALSKGFGQRPRVLAHFEHPILQHFSPRHVCHNVFKLLPGICVGGRCQSLCNSTFAGFSCACSSACLSLMAANLYVMVVSGGRDVGVVEGVSACCRAGEVDIVTPVIRSISIFLARSKKNAVDRS